MILSGAEFPVERVREIFGVAQQIRVPPLRLQSRLWRVRCRERSLPCLRSRPGPRWSCLERGAGHCSERNFAEPSGQVCMVPDGQRWCGPGSADPERWRGQVPAAAAARHGAAQRVGDARYCGRGVVRPPLKRVPPVRPLDLFLVSVSGGADLAPSADLHNVLGEASSSGLHAVRNNSPARSLNACLARSRQQHVGVCPAHKLSPWLLLRFFLYFP